MPLLTLTDVCLAIGDQALLDHANLSIDAGERVCLIGRNGAGKTSLFRLLAGGSSPDAGTVYRQDGLRIGRLDQELPGTDGKAQPTVFDVVADGLADVKALVRRYEETAATDLDARGLEELERLQQAIDDQSGWDLDGRVRSLLKEMQLPPDKPMAELSGGWKRRVALAKALIANPDLLLLDEPTNHLDLETISWLEERAMGFPGALLFITHDRALLSRLATRIVHLDRGRLTSWPGDYANFLRRSQAMLMAEDRANELFDKKLEQEEAWIRQGIKARRTRNEGRVRALEQMRREVASRAGVESTAKMTIQSAGSSGKRVIELQGVGHGYGGRILFEDLSLAILRGDRLGLVGNNGVGKTTLLNIMLGRVEPDEGSVKFGTRLDVAYFDQLKQELDPSMTVAEAVADGGEFVEVNGSRRHVLGYLSDFLFTPKRSRTRIDVLSGGERHRIALARLFTRASNLLVLDEPTNDLDLQTLEILETRLIEYTGTLLLVSHDRTFIDNVVSSCLVFEQGEQGEKGGAVVRHAGGFSDWYRLGRRLEVHEEAESAPEEKGSPTRKAQPKPPSPRARDARRKLSYKLQRELLALPAEIETLEAEVGRLEAVVDGEGFYQLPYEEEVQPVLSKLEKTRADLDRLLLRWVELEESHGE